jgi:predicted small secreted protein
MNQRIGILILSLLVVAGLLAACNGPGPASPLSLASDGVPRALHTIEGSGEDIVDLAASGNWDKVAEKMTAITNAWNAYRPQATAAGASQVQQEALSSALARLQTASAAKDTPAARQAANDLGAAVLDLYALYNPPTPTDIGRLDVSERQIIIDVEANNYTAAAASVVKTRSLWANVKESVLNHKGQSVADKFEASLSIQETALQAKDVPTLTTEVNNGLEIVDELEKLY